MTGEQKKFGSFHPIVIWPSHNVFACLKIEHLNKCKKNDSIPSSVQFITHKCNCTPDLRKSRACAALNAVSFQIHFFATKGRISDLYHRFEEKMGTKKCCSQIGKNGRMSQK